MGLVKDRVGVYGNMTLLSLIKPNLHHPWKKAVLYKSEIILCTIYFPSIKIL